MCVCCPLHYCGVSSHSTSIAPSVGGRVHRCGVVVSLYVDMVDNHSASLCISFRSTLGDFSGAFLIHLLLFPHLYLHLVIL